MGGVGGASGRLSGPPARVSSRLALCLGALLSSSGAARAGGPLSDFAPVVGAWSVAQVGRVRGVRVDGSRGAGLVAPDLPEQARRLFGDRDAEFIAATRLFAFYPLAVHRGDAPPGDLRLRVRFYAQAGKVDQAAGVIFGLQPDGSYHGVRANILEQNLVLFHVERGRRTMLDNVRRVLMEPTTWHRLTVSVTGRRVEVDLNGQHRLTRDLDAAPAGRVGLWSKSDSQVVFDGFEVAPLAPAGPGSAPVPVSPLPRPAMPNVLPLPSGPPPINPSISPSINPSISPSVSPSLRPPIR